MVIDRNYNRDKVYLYHFANLGSSLAVEHVRVPGRLKMKSKTSR